jgi:hypothetical protein
MADTVIRITLQSLALLGFRADRYGESRSASCPALDAHTFDKSNERPLLLAVHFLLSRVDNGFERDSAICWPYHDAKEKNQFKLIVEDKLTHLAEQSLLPTDVCKSSVLNIAKGFVAWKLLWKLSDLAMRQFLNISEETGPIDVERLEQEYEEILKHNQETIQFQRDCFEYAQNLYERYKNAVSNIQRHKRDLMTLENGADTGPILTPQARIERTAMKLRITSNLNMLQEFNDSKSILLVKNKIAAHVANRNDEIVSIGTAKFLDELPLKLFVTESDRVSYVAKDERDLNEHIDILIEKLKKSKFRFNTFDTTPSTALNLSGVSVQDVVQARNSVESIKEMIQNISNTIDAIRDDLSH